MTNKLYADGKGPRYTYTDAYGRNAGYALNGARQAILGYDEPTGRLVTMQTATTEEGGNVHSPTPTHNSNSFTWTYLPNNDLKAQLAYPTLRQYQFLSQPEGLGRAG